MRALYTLAHLFIPRESNNYKARVLHFEVISLFVLLYVLFQASFNVVSIKFPKILGFKANISPAVVVELANQERVKENLSTLEWSDVLSVAAEKKGEDMLTNDYWAHISPSGIEPWEFFLAEGYQYRYAGENLASDFSNPRDAIEAWMASASHRENMLSPKYKEIGVAVVEGDLNGVDTT